MSRVNEFKAGDRLNEARLKAWADAINRVHNFGPGKWEELNSELALFEVGNAWVAGSGPSATPPEPNGYYKSTDCHLVYYFPGTGEYHIKTGTDRGYTIWSVNAGKTAPSLSPGDFAWCVYNIQASRWEVLTSTGGGGGAEIISFRVLSQGVVFESGAYITDKVLAQVLDVNCPSASVEVGDFVHVWDPYANHFDVPMDILLGSRGVATKMRWDPEQGFYGDEQHPNYPEPDDDGCWWMVTSMACVEEWLNKEQT